MKSIIYRFMNYSDYIKTNREGMYLQEKGNVSIDLKTCHGSFRGRAEHKLPGFFPSFSGVVVFISSKMPDKPFYNHPPRPDYHISRSGDSGN